MIREYDAKNKEFWGDFEYSKYTRLVKDDSIILNIIGKFNVVCEIFFLNIDWYNCKERIFFNEFERKIWKY